MIEDELEKVIDNIQIIVQESIEIHKKAINDLQTIEARMMYIYSNIAYSFNIIQFLMQTVSTNCDRDVYHKFTDIVKRYSKEMLHDNI